MRRMTSSYTVEDLIGALEEMDPQAPVMVAVQPMWPLEHDITGVVCDCNGTVYLAASEKMRIFIRRGQRSIRSSWYTIPGRQLILICKYKLNCLYL